MLLGPALEKDSCTGKTVAHWGKGTESRAAVRSIEETLSVATINRSICREKRLTPNAVHS